MARYTWVYPDEDTGRFHEYVVITRPKERAELYDEYGKVYQASTTYRETRQVSAHLLDCVRRDARRNQFTRTEN